MAKISVKKTKTMKQEVFGDGAGLLKVKDGRVHKKKNGKMAEAATVILGLDVKNALQGPLTKLNTIEDVNASSVTSKKSSKSKISLNGEIKKLISSNATELSLEKSAMNNSTLDKLEADVSAEKEKKAMKLKKRSLDQSVNAVEDTSVSMSPSKKQKEKAGKLGRLEKLKVIEEVRKKKQKQRGPNGTTAELRDVKISLDDLQPDLDGVSKSLAEFSKKPSKKVKGAKNGSIAEKNNNSDTDSDDEDAKEDEAICKSYINDFGFDEVVNEVTDEKNREEDRQEEKKLKEINNKRKKIERDTTELERTVEVKNVNIKTKRHALKTVFEKFGKVGTIRYRNIPVESVEKYKMKQIMNETLNKERFSMSAFVKFANVESAKNALQANTSEVCGHHIIVTSSVRKSPHEQRKDLAQGCTVCLGNLPFGAEEEPVYNHFESCGSIVSISISRNEGRATGVGFVKFKTKEAAAAAIKLNNTKMQKRAIRVTKAVRKVKANKRHVQDTTTRKAGWLGAPFPAKGGAKTPQRPFSSSGAAAGKKGVQSRLSRPGQNSATPGTFTGNKFDQSLGGAARRIKERQSKEQVKKIMLAKKLTSKKP